MGAMRPPSTKLLIPQEKCHSINSNSKAGSLVARDARLALQSTASAGSFSRTPRISKPAAARIMRLSRKIRVTGKS